MRPVNRVLPVCSVAQWVELGSVIEVAPGYDCSRTRRVEIMINEEARVDIDAFRRLTRLSQ